MIYFRIISSTSLPRRNFSRKRYFKNNSDLSSLFHVLIIMIFRLSIAALQPAVTSPAAGPNPGGRPEGNQLFLDLEPEAKAQPRQSKNAA